jgi:hypothetical protein
MSTDATEREARLQHFADPLSHDDHRVTRSTMMGFPCLRVDDRFFACVERAIVNLIVNLPTERINELLRTGTGRPVAPNGRVLKA